MHADCQIDDDDMARLAHCPDGEVLCDDGTCAADQASCPAAWTAPAADVALDGAYVEPPLCSEYAAECMDMDENDAVTCALNTGGDDCVAGTDTGACYFLDVDPDDTVPPCKPDTTMTETCSGTADEVWPDWLCTGTVGDDGMHYGTTIEAKCSGTFVNANGREKRCRRKFIRTGECPAGCDYEPEHTPMCMVEDFDAGTCSDGCVSCPLEPLACASRRLTCLLRLADFRRTHAWARLRV